MKIAIECQLEHTDISGFSLFFFIKKNSLNEMELNLVYALFDRGCLVNIIYI